LKFALTREDLDEIEFAISAIASNKLYDASFGKDKINAENKVCVCIASNGYALVPCVALLFRKRRI